MGLVSNLLKNQNYDEKGQELRNLIKMSWIVEILNLFSAYIFVNLLLILMQLGKDAAALDY